MALWLGHEQIATAQIYLHADMTQKERGHRQSRPASNHTRPLPATRPVTRLPRTAIVMPTRSSLSRRAIRTASRQTSSSTPATPPRKSTGRTAVTEARNPQRPPAHASPSLYRAGASGDSVAQMNSLCAGATEIDFEGGSALARGDGILSRKHVLVVHP